MQSCASCFRCLSFPVHMTTTALVCPRFMCSSSLTGATLADSFLTDLLLVLPASEPHTMLLLKFADSKRSDLKQIPCVCQYIKLRSSAGHTWSFMIWLLSTSLTASLEFSLALPFPELLIFPIPPLCLQLAMLPFIALLIWQPPTWLSSLSSKSLHEPPQIAPDTPVFTDLYPYLHIFSAIIFVHICPTIRWTLRSSVFVEWIDELINEWMRETYLKIQIWRYRCVGQWCSHEEK